MGWRYSGDYNHNKHSGNGNILTDECKNETTIAAGTEEHTSTLMCFRHDQEWKCRVESTKRGNMGGSHIHIHCSCSE